MARSKEAPVQALIVDLHKEVHSLAVLCLMRVFAEIKKRLCKKYVKDVSTEDLLTIIVQMDRTSRLLDVGVLDVPEIPPARIDPIIPRVGPEGEHEILAVASRPIPTMSLTGKDKKPKQKKQAKATS